jgi:hypothetical protein
MRSEDDEREEEVETKLVKLYTQLQTYLEEGTLHICPLIYLEKAITLREDKGCSL